MCETGAYTGSSCETYDPCFGVYCGYGFDPHGGCSNGTCVCTDNFVMTGHDYNGNIECKVCQRLVAAADKPDSSILFLWQSGSPKPLRTGVYAWSHPNVAWGRPLWRSVTVRRMQWPWFDKQRHLCLHRRLRWRHLRGSPKQHYLVVALQLLYGRETRFSHKHGCALWMDDLVVSTHCKYRNLCLRQVIVKNTHP